MTYRIVGVCYITSVIGSSLFRSHPSLNMKALADKITVICKKSFRILSDSKQCFLQNKEAFQESASVAQASSILFLEFNF